MSTTAPAPTNGHHRKVNGVRTYRGRKLEDLIPKIRAELGPDAIILREREGLMGGINGFFAQRFVEVEARAATPRVDVYDDDEDSLDDIVPPAQAPAPAVTPSPAATPPPVAAAPVVPELPPPTPPTSAAPSSAETFAAQLEQAAAAAFDDFVVEEPQPSMPAPAPEPATPEPALVIPQPHPEALVGKPRPARKSRAAAKPRAPRNAPAAKTPLVETPAVDTVMEPAPSPTRRIRRPRQQPTVANPAADVAQELVHSGISDAWTYQLIGEAGAHAAPFARQGGLRGAVRGAIASSIVHARPLPAAGAAVAFVGAGGAGKTRCVATLAAAYKRASTLSVFPVSLASADGGRELAELLRSEGVAVSAAKDASSLARRVAKARSGGLVIVDTPAVAPSDAVAVQTLASELEPLSLDAIYVVLPATLGAQTGKRLLTGLAPLRPTALAISHADETDQLGIAVELACASRIPVNYIHEGLDIRTALSGTDPFQLASRLLP